MPFLNRGLLCFAVLVLITGCSSLSYYNQATRGHWQVLQARQPIKELLAAPETPESLAERLRLVEQAREFAHRELHLPDNGSYEDYADLGRPYVVWNVFAAPEFSLEPVQSCFPLIGCVSYRGYYAEEDARAFAAELAAQGNDVFVGGVAAYSTLGWFDDPVLNTMLRWDDMRLVEVLFHEMAHAVAYAADDTAFNESFATAVQREGIRRFSAAGGDSSWPWTLEQDAADRRFALELIDEARAELEALYRSRMAHEAMRQRKQAIFEKLRKKYQAEAPGGARYAGWFAGDLNNARLAALGSYQSRVAAFDNLLAAVEGDLTCFYDEVRRVAELPGAARQDWLDAWQVGGGATVDCRIKFERQQLDSG